MSLDAPLYTHDCAECVFLGSARQHDLYYCELGLRGYATVIARFGNEPPEYTSGMALAAVDPILAEALARAKARGLSRDK